MMFGKLSVVKASFTNNVVFNGCKVKTYTGLKESDSVKSTSGNIVIFGTRSVVEARPAQTVVEASAAPTFKSQLWRR